MPQGVAAGVAGPDRFVVWSRCDRPARMVVEYATTDRFTDVRRIPGRQPSRTTDSPPDGAAGRCRGASAMFYRVLFQDLADLRRFSRPEAGAVS